MELSNFELARFAREFGREYVEYCTSPRNVICGEAHGDKYDVDPQIAFIKRFRPPVVLHEFAGIGIYDPTTSSWSQRREEGDVAPYHKYSNDIIVGLFKELADEYDFLLVGCDITLGERAYLVEQRGGRFQTDQQIIEHREEMGLPENTFLGVSCLDLADPERHKEMASVYNQYRNTPEGILMIAGLYHVKGRNLPDWERSDLHDLLEPPDYGVTEHRQNVEVKKPELVLV